MAQEVGIAPTPRVLQTRVQTIYTIPGTGPVEAPSTFGGTGGSLTHLITLCRRAPKRPAPVP